MGTNAQKEKNVQGEPIIWVPCTFRFVSSV